ncbi:MAG: 4'-phosphopantetheinyl transferase superfamily protein [Bacteroidales bacterium]|nr:4'-phosphopantetheinyl transferase superfamily protein [Bacteroidales bacterium]
MVEVFGIKLPDDKTFRLKEEALFGFTPVKHRDGIRKYKNFNDLKRSLLGEVLSRKVLGKKRNTPCLKLNIKKSEKGKPFLKGINDFFFNVSHSADWVVCAFGPLEVGLDIEKIRKPVYRIAERYFSSHELNTLNKLDGQEKALYFFDLWTLKESYLKMLGKGLTKSLGSFTIIGENGDFLLKEDGSSRQDVFFKQYTIDSNFKLSCCSQSCKFVEKVQIFSFDELINYNKGE